MPTEKTQSGADYLIDLELIQVTHDICTLSNVDFVPFVLTTFLFGFLKGENDYYDSDDYNGNSPLTDGDIGFLIILAWFLGFGVMLFLLSIFSDS